MVPIENRDESSAEGRGTNRHERRASRHVALAYSVNDACHLLGIGRSTLYEEITAGRIKAVKCGTRTIIPASSAAAWLDSLPAKAS